MPLQLKKSNRKGKKYMVVGDNRTIHFGQANARDFTKVSSPKSRFYLADEEERNKVKRAYRSRHKKDNLDNPYSPGALSWWLLWNKPTLRASLRDYKKRFGITINM
tara:strand:- start:76 stop:393 length:318 start_codon:yes stop_codon:yes gene_type:complete